MSSYGDINDGDLYYTEELGWIDKGHANGIGASTLFSNIKNEGEGSFPWMYTDYFGISYTQDMGKYFLNSGYTTHWLIKKGLSEYEQKSVALAIFMNTSLGFEAHQEMLSLDSGYSCEDLVSNLYGFYKAVEGVSFQGQITRYSKEYAKKIWRYYGPVGKYKMRKFKILYFPDPDKTINAKPYEKSLPTWLTTITPMRFPSSNLIKLTSEQFFGIKNNDKKLRLIGFYDYSLFN